MNDLSKLEYLIYHFNAESYAPNLPGFCDNGTLDCDYFSGIEYIPSAQEQKEKLLSLFSSLDVPDSCLLLCSGGVDSSVLASKLHQKSSGAINLLHTSYIDHGKNDLSKLLNVIQAYSSTVFIISASEKEYSHGLKLMHQHKLLQNTYAPTLLNALHQFTSCNQDKNVLLTGSGPDELFYGMEKYDWSFFESLRDMSIGKALREIDVAYNLEAYCSILNDYGIELFKELQKKKEALYEKIANVSQNIFEAQRILAYVTVTAQHMHLFDQVADLFNMKHIAPYLNPEIISTSFQIPAESMINPKASTTRVEIGKFILKTYASEFFSHEHIFSEKIGFHAPTTRFIHSLWTREDLKIVDLDLIPKFIDKDKLISLLDQRRQLSLNSDYFLFSLYNSRMFC